MKTEIKEIALYNANGEVVGYSFQNWKENEQGIMVLENENRTYYGLEEYILSCPIEDVLFDEYKRPYYKFNGKVYLSRKKEYTYQVSN